MKRTRRQRVAVLTFCLLAGFMIASIGLTWRQVQQLRLNQALIAALKANKRAQIASLLALGADPNTRISPEQPGFPMSSQGFFALLRNAWNVRNRPRQLTSTALCIAVEQGNLEAARLLLDKGADPNARTSKDGTTALTIACRHLGPRLRMMQLLLTHGADVNTRTTSGSTPLYEEVTSILSDVPQVQLLLDHGADVNAVDSQGISILMAASVAEDERFIALLLKRGANVDYRLKTGETALTFARQIKDERIVSLLKQYGARDTEKQQ